MRKLMMRSLGLALALAAGAVGGIGVAQTAPAQAAQAAPAADPGRLAPLVVRATADYDLEVVAARTGDLLTADIRRTDLVGNRYPGLDSYGYLTSSGWGDIGGTRCLATSSVGTLSFPGATDRDASYGLAGTGIARIELVLTDGTEVVARRGQATQDGLRGWIAVTPTGTAVERAYGYNSSGTRVATVDNLDESFGFGASPTCG